MNFTSEGTPSLACILVCTFEYQVGEEGYSGGIDDLQPVHPLWCPAFSAVSVGNFEYAFHSSGIGIGKRTPFWA